MRPVNLIPGEQRAQATGAQSGSAYVVVGVLAVLLGMAAFYTITSNKVSQNKADAAQAKTQADELESRATSLGAFSTFAAIKETRLASVRSVADSRFDWERMMRELARVLPDKTWLLEVDASVTGATGDTSTASQAGGAGPPATKLIGCAPSQSDVAKMMVRLRALHKVSNVALNDSSRGETQGDSGGLEGCTRYQFDLTVTFGATAPEEAPRASKRVPTSLGGGS